MKLRYLGTQMPYPYEVTKDTPPPTGYQPFYINYIGRHGFHYYKSPQSLVWVTYAMMNAGEQQGLLPLGEILKRQLEGFASEQVKRFDVINQDDDEISKGLQNGFIKVILKCSVKISM